ncbi:ANL_collapsed_G0037640.mRNA.1.CDS.1 [Saccharomyces cerevisiae]|nr:ANL_HP_G0062150.mRNA.1.CDS.1 [Saccharomyces cerevisiae]CAI5026581.1 ANL_HP_G0076390.mRNA.1.CDS.1 [Saccharomyces cerevisiae]CAI5129490.1 ANL_HP_G0115060.mRNA.1.CDS.1 [Saccharomyces cerevisiae]CAI6812431.1 ANL_collapsed_G0037640.mRNA.1.CDS.1 [Saccharomyces cerevisiae]CAI6926182.1 ANL_HP_G0062150.mRNA.1.CDS.1 [Saccharomyces cerevisiae]
MDNEEVNEECMRLFFKNARAHLDKHLTSRLTCDENAYITFRCFLDGIHCKSTRFLEELLLKQENMYHNNNYERINDSVIPLVLKLLWLQIHEPTLQWFEHWFHDIMRLSNRRKFRVFRIFQKKMIQFFKITHRYYYDIIEHLCAKYDMNSVISNALFAKLNLMQYTDGLSTHEKIILNTSNPLTFSIVISLQRCVINLGSTHFYKTLLNKPSNKPKSVEGFEKSIRYLNIASLYLPAVGDTYFQRAKIYLITGKFSLYFFELVRGALVRIPSKCALNNLKDFILTPNFPERRRLMKKLAILVSKDLKGEKSFFEGQIVLQFLSIVEHTLVPQSWNASRASNCWLLKEHLQIAALKYHSGNINVILENLAATMGSFDLMFTTRKSKEQKNKLKYADLSERQVFFLDLSFDFIANIIDVVIKPSWQKNMEDFRYLAIIRLLMCWIKSYRSILQYTHRHRKFCTSFALLLNDLINSPLNCSGNIYSHRPKRSYLFREDIIFREFSCINFALTDFNDDYVYDSPDMINNIIGCPTLTKVLSPKEECVLRIRSIIFSGMKFLEKNDTGVIWNASKYKFDLISPNIKIKRQIALSEISSKINVKTQQERVVSSRKVEAKRDEQQRKRAGKIAVTELEKQFANVRRTKKLSPLPEKDGVSSELVKHAASRGRKTITGPVSSDFLSYPDEAIDADEDITVQVPDTPT